MVHVSVWPPCGSDTLVASFRSTGVASSHKLSPLGSFTFSTTGPACDTSTWNRAKLSGCLRSFIEGTNTGSTGASATGSAPATVP